MNNLATQSNLTMSSREIAELTSKQHKNVKRDIALMLMELGLDGLNFERIYFDSMNRQQVEYVLPKDETLCLMAGYDIKARMKIIKRWQELEQEAAKPALPQTYLEALEKLVESERDKQEAQQEVQRLQQVCETITDQFTPGMTPRQFCSMLNGVNLQKVQPLLERKRYIRKTEYGYRSMPAYRDDLFADRRGENERGRPVEVVTLTLKGAKRIYKMYLKGELEMKKDWDRKYTHDLFGRESTELAMT